MTLKHLNEKQHLLSHVLLLVVVMIKFMIEHSNANAISNVIHFVRIIKIINTVIIFRPRENNRWLRKKFRCQSCIDKCKAKRLKKNTVEKHLIGCGVGTKFMNEAQFSG